MVVIAREDYRVDVVFYTEMSILCLRVTAFSGVCFHDFKKCGKGFHIIIRTVKL